MNKLICQVSNIGKITDWIKLGLNYYGWNYLLLITTNDKEYIKISEDLKLELEQSTRIDIGRELDLKSTRKIEILVINNRDILNFITFVKKKLKEIHENNYLIYYNATSGLQSWKFAMNFIYTEEDYIEKFYYFPTDTPKNQKISPMEFFKPLKISKSLKRVLSILKNRECSLDDIIDSYEKKKEDTKVSKGLISRYVSELKSLELIAETEKRRDRKKLFYLTDKGKWFV
ncbi:MAG: hypothetical protein ACTSVV_08755 [Promethearchaeota archaeon]